MILLVFFLAWLQPVIAQDKHRIIKDTVHGKATESFLLELSNLDSLPHSIGYNFIYDGPDSVSILRAWTNDPHYICQYPEGILKKGKVYFFKICFARTNAPGLFSKNMGFYLSNGAIVTFVVTGKVLSHSP